MGEFAGYVWAAYGISLVALVALTAFTVAAWNRAKRNLKAIQDSETNL